MKAYLVITVNLFFMMSGLSFAQDTLEDYCLKKYEQEKICPPEVCHLSCLGDEQEQCEMTCLYNSCVEINAQNCPLDYCQILKGCNDGDVCFFQLKEEPPFCGDMAYAGQKVECCEGYVKRCGMEYFDGTCDMVGEGTDYNVPICIPCGNGYCNQFENTCNCPEDCE